MITASFQIRFDFLVDTERLNITLEADVQEHNSNTYYVVGNFRIPGHNNSNILPEISIRKEKGLWVHVDSHKASELSKAAGKAIEGSIAPSEPLSTEDTPPPLE
jgi:hypothetical protein